MAMTMTTAFDQLVDAPRNAGKNVTVTNDKATAQCPAHDDRNPLLADNPGLVGVRESDVRERFGDHPAESWRSAVQRLVADDIDAADGLADAARTQLAQQLRASNDGDGETGGD